MTIIASDGQRMVADSWCFRDGLGSPMPHPKIVKAPDGGIVGACGARSDCDAIRRWAANGFHDEDKPSLGGDSEAQWLHLRPDGTLWHGSSNGQMYQVIPPFSIGVQMAGLMVEGAMLCGVDLVDAVQMAVDRCDSVGGPLTILSL